MKHTLLLMIILVSFSCAEKKHIKTSEEASAEALLQAQEIAAPHIAEDTALFNLYVRGAQDTSNSYGQRVDYLRKIHSYGYEYTAGFGLDKINTPEVNYKFQLQKELIAAQWMDRAGKAVYQQALTDLERAKRELRQAQEDAK